MMNFLPLCKAIIIPKRNQKYLEVIRLDAYNDTDRG